MSTSKTKLPGLAGFLARDLRLALAAGVERDAVVTPDGGRWLVCWALIAALVAATLFLFCGYHAGFARVNGLASQVDGWIWECLTLLGDERAAFALALFFSRRHPRVFWSLLLAALFATAYSQSLKHLFAMPRPPAVLEPGSFNLHGPDLHRNSFPSGHTVTASVFFGIWVYYLRSVGLRSLAILLAVAAGLSRVALGVHWPVDVAAGMAGGALAAWAGARLGRRWSWGLQDASVHLAFVTVAVFPTIALLLWDRGYHDSAELQQLIGSAALASLLVQYLLWPSWRWLRDRTAEEPAG